MVQQLTCKASSRRGDAEVSFLRYDHVVHFRTEFKVIFVRGEAIIDHNLKVMKKMSSMANFEHPAFLNKL